MDTLEATSAHASLTEAIENISKPPFWMVASPEERAEAFLAWTDSHKPTPGLPDSAIRRETFYEEQAD